MAENEGKKEMEVKQENIRDVNETAKEIIQTALLDEKKSQTGTGVGNSQTDQFSALPIESLICKPILAAAQGQQELTAVYIDTIKKLAYKDGGTATNTLDFTYDRPVVNPDGMLGTETSTIKAPLISLVPVPAFTMDELVVDFNMEVKSMDLSTDKTHKDVSSTVSYNSWFGLDASITGSVSSDTEHKRQTDSSATYNIHARAVQQPPSEGMAKLTALLAQTMEPIKTKS